MTNNADPNFSRIIEVFINRIQGLKMSFPIVINAFENSEKEIQQKFINFASQQSITQTDTTITIPLESATNFKQLWQENMSLSLASNIIKRNFIISLVSEFDIHLANLVKAICLTKPEILNSSERHLSFKELIQFKTLDEARNDIIDREIDGLLRDSHAEHFKWLEKKLGIDTLRKFSSWSNFIEITERRNLFVHCDGCISTQYLTICQENNVDINDYKLGAWLQVDETYFNNAYKCIFEVGVKLVHVIWRKLKPEERESADTALNNLAVDILTSNDYLLANLILDFAMQEPSIFKKMADGTKLLVILNKAQTLKWEGKNQDAIDNLLKDTNWNILSDEFKLANAVLIDNFDDAYQIMKKIGNNSKMISKIHYREWPIFREFRKSQQFLQGYEEVFSEPFDQPSLLNEEPLMPLSNAENN
ncbi:hypothetical protein WJM97_03930 [Okeanomitos corallinicola TIOX110]|uniref:Uncharacterized protein n=1 Tax=Okeanomitos corallinicola TIOX110 TaxID=3133117 RepID=A0ABZ2UV47_9CYAN